MTEMKITSPASSWPPSTPAQALAELQAGNHRFVTGTRVHPNQDAEHRAALAQAQTPFAVVFGCSDSRLAAEIIFDRGLGDLFVVRTAGHVVDSAVLGSLEYAVRILETPLVVVLGHNSCGAVQAARDAVLGADRQAGHLATLVDALVPSVERAAAQNKHEVNEIVDVHIERTLELLVDQSAVLASAIEDGRCVLTGMSYELTGGRVRAVPPAVAASSAGTTKAWSSVTTESR